MATNRTVPFAARFTRCRHRIEAAFLAVWLDPFWLRLHSTCLPVFHCYTFPRCWGTVHHVTIRLLREVSTSALLSGTISVVFGRSNLDHAAGKQASVPFDPSVENAL